jgi:hypothetical protein
MEGEQPEPKEQGEESTKEPTKEPTKEQGEEPTKEQGEEQGGEDQYHQEEEPDQLSKEYQGEREREREPLPPSSPTGPSSSPTGPSSSPTRATSIHLSSENKKDIETVKQAMEDKTKHVFVFFYMNGCGHCDQVIPVWDNELVKGNTLGSKTYLVRVNNAVSGNITDNVPSSFPCFRYYNGKNSHIDSYDEGDRTAKDLLSWMMRHMKAQMGGKGRSTTRGRERGRGRGRGRRSIKGKKRRISRTKGRTRRSKGRKTKRGG